MFCKNCAYPNLPIYFTCQQCCSVMHSVEDTDRTKREWDIMPNKMRMEFEAKCKVEQERWEEHNIFLRKSRMLHTIVGSALGGVTGLLTGIVIIPDVVLGAVACYYLNHRGGGQYTGMALFGIIYIVSSVLKGAFAMAFTDAFYLPIWAGGLLLAICGGGAFGIYLDIGRFYRGI